MIFLLILFSLAWSDVGHKQVIENVLLQFPAIQMSKEDINIAQAEQLTAEGAFDLYWQSQWTQQEGNYNYQFLNSRLVKPTSLLGIDIYGGFRKSLGDIPDYDGQMQTLSSGEWSIGIKVPLLRGLWIDERRAQFRKNTLLAQQRRLQLKSVELEQLRMALHKYWDWQLALQRITINKRLLELATQRDEWLTKRVKAGDVALLELKDNRRTILQRQSLLLQSEWMYEQNLADLEYFIGMKESFLKTHAHASDTHLSQTIVASEIQHLAHSDRDLVSLAIQNRPEILALDLQKEQQNIDQQLQSNRWLPKLDVDAQYAKDRGEGSSSLIKDEVKWQVTLEVPLQYRRIRGQNEQITAQLEKTQYQKNMLERRIRADIAQLQKGLVLALQRRTLADEESKLAKILEEGERKRFKHGETNILTLNLREQASAEAQLRLIETSVESIRLFITLKTFLGEIPNLDKS